MSNTQPRAEDVLISKGSAVEGKIMSGGTVTVAGKVTGEISCQTLIVQPGGMVNGIVSSKEAHVAGSVGENITVENVLHIDGTGIVSGKCSYGTLEIAKGGKLNGQVLHNEKKAAAMQGEGDDAERLNGVGEHSDQFIQSFANGSMHLNGELKIPA
jgi:cytoskeletal protein CcmA (bactofilin family)